MWPSGKNELPTPDVRCWTHMLNTVNDLPGADLQNIDSRATGAKDVFLIFADLKQKERGQI